PVRKRISLRVKEDAVFFPGKSDGLDLTHPDAVEPDWCADLKPLDRLNKVGFHLRRPLEPSARPENDDADDEQGNRPDHEKTDLEMVSLLAHDMSGRFPRYTRLPVEKLSHPRILRVIPQISRPPLGDDGSRALVQHDYPVGDRLDAWEFVRDDNEGDF